MSKTPKHNKAFGQHFLVDEGILNAITKTIREEEEVCPVQNMIEIGPGDGALTKHFIDQPNFSALEIAIEKNIPIEIVDPNPIEIQYPNIEYHKMNASEYCNK